MMGVNILIVGMLSAITGIRAGENMYRYIKKQTPSLVCSVAAGDLNHDGKDEIIIGGMDGYIRTFNNKFEEIWNFNVKAIPYVITAEDVNGDGIPEVLVGSWDEKGSLYILSPKGKLKRRIVTGHLYHAIKATDIDGDGFKEIIAASKNYRIDIIGQNGEIKTAISSLRGKWEYGPKAIIPHFYFDDICSMDVGDIDGDGKEELVYVSGRGPHALLYAVKVRGKKYATLWKKPLQQIAKTSNVAAISAFLRCQDINEDGKAEILVYLLGGAVSILEGNEGKNLFFFPVAPGDGIGVRFNTLFFVDMKGEGKKIAVGGFGRLQLFSPEGELEHVFDFWPFAFWDLTTGDIDGDGKEEIIASSRGGRERAFYVIRWGRKGKPFPLIKREPVNSVRVRPLRRKTINNRPPGRDDPFHIVIVVGCVDLRKVETEKKRLKEFYAPFKEYNKSPYLDIALVFHFTKEQYINLSSFLPKLLSLAKFLEEEKIPFFVCTSHMGDPFVREEHVEKIIKVAPGSFLGLWEPEPCAGYCWGGPRFFLPRINLLEVLTRYKRKYVFEDHYDPWLLYPSDPFLFKKLFAPAFRDVLIPSSGGNDYLALDLNVGGLLALWMGGKVNEWANNVQFWWWSIFDNCFHNTPADFLLRRYIWGVSLGARYTIIYDVEVKSRKQRVAVFNFLEMIRNGTLVPANREELVSISPVALQLKQDVVKELGIWMVDRVAIRKPRGLLQFGACFQKTHENFLSRYAYDSKVYMDCVFPKNYYGMILIFPHLYDPFSIGRIKKIFKTDLINVEVDGKVLNPSEAKPVILKALEEGAKDLPFRAKGVFCSAQKFKGFYLVYLIEPSFRMPKRVKTVLEINLPGEKYEVVDGLTGERICSEKRRVPVEIPPGSFKILKVILK